MFKLRLRTLILIGFALSSASASADFYGGYCDMSCMTYGSPAFSNFTGTGFVPSNYAYQYGMGGVPGQFQPVDPRVQALNYLAMQDYTPMGTTYGSAVGLQAIQANLMAIPYENSLAAGGAFVPGH